MGNAKRILLIAYQRKVQALNGEYYERRPYQLDVNIHGTGPRLKKQKIIYHQSIEVLWQDKRFK